MTISLVEWRWLLDPSALHVRNHNQLLRTCNVQMDGSLVYSFIRQQGYVNTCDTYRSASLIHMYVQILGLLVRSGVEL